MILYTAGQYNDATIKLIKEGKVGKSKGGVIFTSIKDGELWLKNNYPNGIVYGLDSYTEQCYKDNPSELYPTKKIVVKLIKMVYLDKH